MYGNNISSLKMWVFLTEFQTQIFHLKCESVHDVCSVKLVNQKVNQYFSEIFYFFKFLVKMALIKELP
jgi:hypothetical protein